jgi:hypothetical protein
MVEFLANQDKCWQRVINDSRLWTEKTINRNTARNIYNNKRHKFSFHIDQLKNTDCLSQDPKISDLYDDVDFENPYEGKITLLCFSCIFNSILINKNKTGSHDNSDDNALDAPPNTTTSSTINHGGLFSNVANASNNEKQRKFNIHYEDLCRRCNVRKRNMGAP